ncbi:DoxX family protein [Myroides sp. LJL119]
MCEDFGKLILRLAVGGLMILHGIHKLIYGHEFVVTQLRNADLPEILWVGLPITQILAPLCLIIGFATRISSLLVVFTMGMAVFLTKGMTGFDIDPNTGGLLAELNILFLASALTISLIGPGKLAIYQGDSPIFK